MPTYECSATKNDVKAVRQYKGETLCQYIQHFSQMRNMIPRISNEEVISKFSTGVSDIKMREKLSVNDELTSAVKLFEIADRCAKVEEERLFVHNLPEALPQSQSPRTPSARRLLSSRWSLSISSTAGTTLSAIKVDVAATASSTKRTPTIPTIVGLSESFMKKMVSPSVVGVAVATARVDPRVITAMTIRTRVIATMVCLVQIPSRCRCFHRRMIIGKRTRGAIKSREALPLASWVGLKLLCLIATSSSCRERSRRHSPTPATA
jgi:hypothetical protein